MKKFYLTAAAALMAAGTMTAMEPTVIPDAAIHGLSPDGKYAVSYMYEACTIYDFTTDKSYSFNELFNPGTGNYIANTGLVVGSKIGFDTACYFLGGDWYDMPDVMDYYNSFANAVTVDGKRIVGMVSPYGPEGGLNVDGLMLVPCYWDLQEDGTYGKAHMLPYPEKDLTGRTPQYVTAVCVSDDGKTIAGQIQDFSGDICQPIIYTQGADGEWNYTLLINDLFFPKNFHLPEDPGEAPSTDPTDFMTPEEQAAYERALQEWEDECLSSGDWNYDTYPSAQDYLSEAGKAALAKAEEDFNLWQEKADAFYTAMGELLQLVPTFEFNNVYMTTDGKTYVSTDMKSDFDPMAWEFNETYTPYIIDLANNTYEARVNQEVNVSISSIANNGALLGFARNDDYILNAYIMPAGATQYQTLYSYVAENDAALGAWMKENMTHTYWGMDPETFDFVEKTEMFTGIPVTNPGMTEIGLAVENNWFDWENGDPDTYIGSYGYIFSTDFAGVKGVEAVSTIGIQVLPDATLSFTGEVALVKVYNIQGACLLSENTPGTTLATGLDHGIYVVKAVAADGSALIRKVAF